MIMRHAIIPGFAAIFLSLSGCSEPALEQTPETKAAELEAENKAEQAYRDQIRENTKRGIEERLDDVDVLGDNPQAADPVLNNEAE